MADQKTIDEVAREIQGLFGQESIDAPTVIDRLSRKGPAMRPLTVVFGNEEVARISRSFAEHLLERFGKGGTKEILDI